MGMTPNDFEAKALQVLLSQRFLSLPLFEEEELSEYHIADNQGEMNLEDFIRQYAEVITEQFKSDYENRLKADMVAMLTDLKNKLIDKSWNIDMYDDDIDFECCYLNDIDEIIQQKINTLKENKGSE